MLHTRTMQQVHYLRKNLAMTKNSLKEVNESLTKFILHESVKWWEKKRILYNVILIGFALVFAFAKNEFPNTNWSIESTLSICVWIFGANIFYCGGWGSEVLLKYYVDGKINKNMRKFLFIMGMGASILWTIIALIPYI